MRSDAELRAFSSRLLQSLTLYFSLSRRLTRVRLGLEPPPEADVGTALLESFAMHTRGLADFFFRHKPSTQRKREHDAWALHYFETPGEWAGLVGDPGPWLSRIYRPARKGVGQGVDRFGAQVAHLNYREPPTSHFARGWPVMQLSYEMGVAVAIFSRHVAPTRVQPGFADHALRQVPALSKIGSEQLAPLATWTRPELRMPDGQ